MLKKHGPIYRPILRKAWEITRQNKFLWIFGLFAALAGNGGTYEILFKGFSRIISRGETAFSGTADLWSLGFFAIPRLEEIYTRSPLFVNLFWVIFFLIIVLLAVLFCLTTLSRGALINCVKKLSARRKTDWGDGWAAGKQNFWPLLGLNILAKAVIFGLLVLITIPAMFFIFGGNGSFAWNLFLYILAFVVFTALAIFASFMAIYASCFVVVEGRTMVEAIRASWHLFIRNWLPSLEVAMILFAIVLGVGAAFVLFSVFYLVPVFLLLTAFAYLELPLGFWLIALLATLGWLICLGFIGAILATFQFSAWTLLFIELNKKKVWSKLLRFAGLTK